MGKCQYPGGCSRNEQFVVKMGERMVCFTHRDEFLTRMRTKASFTDDDRDEILRFLLGP